MTKVAYVGDVGVDDYGGVLYPGGCGLNVAYYAKKAGFTIDLISCVGTDEDGQLPLHVAQKNELGIGHVHTIPGKTPRQKIHVLTNGERKFVQYFPGVLSNFNLSNSDIDVITQHEVLMTLHYSQIHHLFEQVAHIPFNGLRVVDFMDGNDFNRDINFVKRYLHQWDIGFFGLSVDDQLFIEDLIQLSRKMKKLVVITLGAEGSLAYWRGNMYEQESKIVKAVDTTGCGDAYLAGFLVDWLKSRDVHRAMNEGASLAAECATHFGSIPKEEVRA